MFTQKVMRLATHTTSLILKNYFTNIKKRTLQLTSGNSTKNDL